MISLQTSESTKIKCLLCPHFCKLSEGETGICGVRVNKGGRIELQTYSVISSYSVDPIEKKPLYHFYPGHEILSIGSFGCNMRCDFCQNHSISQFRKGGFTENISIQKIMTDIRSVNKNIGIAFTYNEPVIWFEYVMDIASAVKVEGYKTVLVSNGFVNSEPLAELIKVTDAFNIDLKAFRNDFYKKLTGSGIEPVKAALKQIAVSGKHLEITTLIIPGQNDNPEDMKHQAEWIASELGSDVPLHLSRYYPNFKRDDPPTAVKNLTELKNIAEKYLNYVYTGNLHPEPEQYTKCPQCGQIVSKRMGYKTHLLNLDNSGHCTQCNNLVYKYFTFSLPKGH